MYHQYGQNSTLRVLCLVLQRWDPNRPAPTMADFDKKLTESDAYLQLMIDQTAALERHIETTEDPDDCRRCQGVLSSINTVLESVKHSIVLLQVRLFGVHARRRIK